MRRFTWLHAFFLACFLHGNEAAKHTCAARSRLFWAAGRAFRPCPSCPASGCLNCNQSDRIRPF